MLKHNLRPTSVHCYRTVRAEVPDFRRYFVSGGTYFFTLVTAGRKPLFRHEKARTLLGDTMREERERAPFETVAIVLLPDHLHVIWTLPRADDDYSRRWQAIKAKFTSQWLALGGEVHGDVCQSITYRASDTLAVRRLCFSISNPQTATNTACTCPASPPRARSCPFRRARPGARRPRQDSQAGDSVPSRPLRPT